MKISVDVVRFNSIIIDVDDKYKVMDVSPFEEQPVDNIFYDELWEFCEKSIPSGWEICGVASVETGNVLMEA